jgi:ribulose-phosphate 3-epimerase
VNPATSNDAIIEVLGMVDMVLVMSVNPGFGGQTFIPRAVEKVSELAWMCGELGIDPLIQVDGGITLETGPLVAAEGARVLVAGNAVFGQPDPVAAMNAIRAAAADAIT